MVISRRSRPAWIFPIPLSVHQRLAACSQSTDAKPESKTKPPATAAEKLSVAEIELRDIHLSFGKKRVLRGLNLSIRKGEATAIIGTSGTGKSTALRVMTGLAMPHTGEVFQRGWKRTRHIAFEQNELNVSMVFQSAALLDSLTVRENVGFKLLQEDKLSYDRIDELIIECLRLVDLEDAIDKYPDQLSGGMRRRVAVARAIIYDPNDPESTPEVMLYDEPTAGLDPTASTRIENIIRSLQVVCPTTVIVTHQFSTIRRTADRVVLMHNGRIAWDGRVEELDTVDDPYIRQFMEGSLEGPLNSDAPSELEEDEE